MLIQPRGLACSAPAGRCRQRGCCCCGATKQRSAIVNVCGSGVRQVFSASAQSEGGPGTCSDARGRCLIRCDRTFDVYQSRFVPMASRAPPRHLAASVRRTQAVPSQRRTLALSKVERSNTRPSGSRLIVRLRPRRGGHRRRRTINTHLGDADHVAARCTRLSGVSRTSSTAGAHAGTIVRAATNQRYCCRLITSSSSRRDDHAKCGRPLAISRRCPHCGATGGPWRSVGETAWVSQNIICSADLHDHQMLARLQHLQQRR